MSLAHAAKIAASGSAKPARNRVIVVPKPACPQRFERRLKSQSTDQPENRRFDAFPALAGGQQLAQAEPMTSPFIVLIAGGSCSGKSTLAQELARRAGIARALIVHEDSYYHHRPVASEADALAVNFDRPEAKDRALLAAHLQALKHGEPVPEVAYDFAQHARRDTGRTLEPKPLIIVEGLHTLLPPVGPLGDLTIFVEAAEHIRIARRIQRDVEERGRTVDGVIKQFQLQVRPAHNDTIEPQRDDAHLIVTGHYDRTSEFAEVRLKEIEGRIKA
jgi:uridine kinase